MKNIMFRIIFVCLIMGLVTISGAMAGNVNTIILSSLDEQQSKILNENVDTSTIYLEFSTPKIQDEGTYITIELDDANYPLSKPGEPKLPYVHRMRTFPLGTKILKVDFSYSNVFEMKLNRSIIPTAKPVALNGRESKSKIVEDASVYQNDRLYPSQWITYHTGGGLDGEGHVTLLSLHVFPIRYNPETETLMFIKEAEVIIEYEYPTSLFTTGDESDLLIIAPRQFKSQAEKLKDHKDSHVRTSIMIVQDIVNNYEGKDKAEKIKHAIKDAVENLGVNYVLLFGGLKGFFNRPKMMRNWYVPVRYSHLDLDGYPESRYLCDLYFADIYDSEGNFCSWDYPNGNGVFGEWLFMGSEEVKDERDLYPDVYVGRLPCRNVWESSLVTEKIINYENSYPAGQEWFKTMLLVAGDSYDDTSEGDLGIIEGKYANLLAFNWSQQRHDFTYVGLWPSETGGDTDLTKDKFIENQNKGSGFTFLSGHGDCGSWFNRNTYADFGNWTYIRRLSLLHLKNNDKLPIVVIGGCHTAGFDKNLFGAITYFTEDAFSWVYTRSMRGGSVATIGNTALEFGVGGEDFSEIYGGYLEAHFFEVYGNQSEILGEIVGRELTQYIAAFKADSDMLHCKTVENWILLGDPTLLIGGYR